MLEIILIVVLVMILLGGGIGYRAGTIGPRDPLAIVLLLVVIMIIIMFVGPRAHFW